MYLSPKFKYNLSRILPFGILFMLVGWLFLLTEVIATRNIKTSQSEVIEVTFNIFIFSSVAVFLFGLFIGFLEIIVFKNLFKREGFRKKLLYKFLLYVFFFLITMLLTYPMAAAIEMESNILSEAVFSRFIEFLFSVTFFNTLFQLSFSLFIALIYSSVSENIGHSVLINFFTGRYAKPREEIRIFMFLDMKSSTSIAEKLGNIDYFNFLKDYYEVFSEPIIEHRGEVYEYIGDEIVITWPYDKGIHNAECVDCFFAMKNALKSQQDYFDHKYGNVPDFKAALHLGRVTIGEIGALKKEITFSGDLMNTTSRIQDMCSELKTDLIISRDLYLLIQRNEKYHFVSKGEFNLKGKQKIIGLYGLED
ncbi:MAG: adenylate/guanylate cyclase domain-containing protein [Cytophagales bacterium]